MGAGPGGLSSAMILAARGFDVTVLEKDSIVGGRNAELKVGDCSFDTGPTFLHIPWIIEEIFAYAGKDMNEYLKIDRVDPFNKIIFPEKTVECYSDRVKMKAEIAKKFPGNEARFDEYLDEEQVMNRSIWKCLEHPYLSIFNYLRWDVLKVAKYVFSFDSVYKKLGRYFPDRHLKLTMSFQTKYLGMTPWKCPGFLSLLSSWEYLYGIYHVEGGLCKLSQAMAKIVVQNGGVVRLNAPVQEVLFERKNMKGVRLEGGEELYADEIVLNADYGYAMTHLMGEKNIPHSKLRRKKSFSCSTFMIYLALDTLYKDEPHHQVIMADDSEKWTNTIHYNNHVPEDMSIYVRNSCVTDSKVAPEGQSGLYVLVPVPNNMNDFNWSERTDPYRKQVLDRVMAKTGMKDLDQHIVAEKTITPDDWEMQHNVFIGATFSLKHTLNQMLFFRPHNRMKGFKNGYLVGSGTHPGSGLLPIYQSGLIAANLISDKHNVVYEKIDYHSKNL